MAKQTAPNQAAAPASRQGEFALTLFSFQGRLGRIRYVAWSILTALISTAIMFLLTIFLADRAVDMLLKALSMTAASLGMLENDILALSQHVDLLWENLDLLMLVQNMERFSALRQEMGAIFSLWGNIGAVLEGYFFYLAMFVVISFLLTLTSLFFGFSLLVRRLHDINLSGWWFFALLFSGILALIMAFVMPFVFIPVVLLVFLSLLLLWFVLLFWPGSAGENSYGLPEPAKVRFSDMTLLVVLVIVVLSVIMFSYELQGKVVALQGMIR